MRSSSSSSRGGSTSFDRSGEASAGSSLANRDVPQAKAKTRLTALQKRDICRRFLGDVKPGHQVVAQEYDVERSTITKVLAQKEKWLGVDDAGMLAEHNRAASSTGPIPRASRKIRSSRYPVIESRLTSWLEAELGRGSTVDDAIVKERAKEISTNTGDKGFKASNGWLDAYKGRVGFQTSWEDGLAQTAFQASAGYDHHMDENNYHDASTEVSPIEQRWTSSQSSTPNIPQAHWVPLDEQYRTVRSTSSLASMAHDGYEAESASSWGNDQSSSGYSRPSVQQRALQRNESYSTNDSSLPSPSCSYSSDGILVTNETFPAPPHPVSYVSGPSLDSLHLGSHRQDEQGQASVPGWYSPTTSTTSMYGGLTSLDINSAHRLPSGSGPSSGESTPERVYGLRARTSIAPYGLRPFERITPLSRVRPLGDMRPHEPHNNDPARPTLATTAYMVTPRTDGFTSGPPDGQDQPHSAPALAPTVSSSPGTCGRRATVSHGSDASTWHTQQEQRAPAPPAPSPFYQGAWHHSLVALPEPESQIPLSTALAAVTTVLQFLSQPSVSDVGMASQEELVALQNLRLKMQGSAHPGDSSMAPPRQH